MSTMPICLAADHQISTNRLHTFPTLVAGLIIGLATFGAVSPALAQDKKPNILFIMGDDIGWMQVNAYTQGLGLAETPNIDRIANEGVKMMTYYAEQSCTAGRNAFFTGMILAAHRHDPAAASRQPVLPAARHAGDCQVSARPWLQHQRVRQEPPRRPYRRAADRARLPRVLGLSSITSMRCSRCASPTSTRARPSKVRSAVQEHANPRHRRSSWRCRSEDNHLPDSSASCPLVQVLGWNVR